ncbi:hypothetical protein [Serratia sp. EWG9]|uniref:hypothetical protein n=1 Tax=Serratia sp. EWG9 TaxID=2785628 RepID=UPI00210224FC|nr:hypothetical protein [Serratia sp. EWG9]
MSVLRILALLAATAAALPAQAKPAAHGAAPENGVRWQSCLNSGFQRWFDEAPPAGLRCGYLDVPLVYATPPAHSAQAGEPTVRLALTLLPATGPKKGSVVVISGGPGLPGINPYLGNDVHVAKLRKSYDIIGYDPRASVNRRQKFPARWPKVTNSLNRTTTTWPARRTRRAP